MFSSITSRFFTLNPHILKINLRKLRYKIFENKKVIKVLMVTDFLDHPVHWMFIVHVIVMVTYLYHVNAHLLFHAILVATLVLGAHKKGHPKKVSLL